MASERTSIFIIGATGYVGGSVLARLLAHPLASTFAITALVRSAEKAALFESKFGVRAVVGSLADASLLESLSQNAQVVVSCADCDDVPSIQAILRGMKKRHEELGTVPILIHTSGTGVIAQEAKGMFVTDTIYDDTDLHQIETIPPIAPHRPVDLIIVEADTQGYVRSHIILPSTIYGVVSNPLVDAGLQNPRSMQIPQLIRASLDRGRAGVVGKGVARWANVHVDDVSDIYILLFDAIFESPEAVGHGREGFYFAENGEHAWCDISQELGRVFGELGITTNALSEPTAFTDEELVKYWRTEDFGNFMLGSNSRCRANRSRALGWKPTKTTADMIASIKEEVEAAQKRKQSRSAL